jgi:aminoglycoside phosphotransferase (APT) family kinase protein
VRLQLYGAVPILVAFRPVLCAPSGKRYVLRQRGDMTKREPAGLSTDRLLMGLAAAVADYNAAGNALVHIGGYLRRSAVFSCGNLIVKCFFHSAEKKFAHECLAYNFIAGSGLPVPVLIASGRLHAGPPWILTTKLPGQEGAIVWKSLKIRARIDLNHQAGRLLAKLHLLPVDERLTGLSLSDAVPKYLELLALRLERYAREAALIDDRATSRAHARAWTANLQRYVPQQLCFTHGDFSMRNLMFREIDGAWEISGLFDFEQCEYGDPAADFARMLVATEDWNSEEFSSFLDAYAGLAPLPARERVLLHLGAIALDAAGWAYGKDQAYYKSILDIVDRIEAEPKALPARFPHAGAIPDLN